MQCRHLSVCIVLYQEIEVIHAKCWDVAVSGKKQAIQSLTSLLKEFPHNATLQRFEVIVYCWCLLDVRVLQCNDPTGCEV